MRLRAALDAPVRVSRITFFGYVFLLGSVLAILVESLQERDVTSCVLIIVAFAATCSLLAGESSAG